MIHSFIEQLTILRRVGGEDDLYSAAEELGEGGRWEVCCWLLLMLLPTCTRRKEGRKRVMTWNSRRRPFLQHTFHDHNATTNILSFTQQQHDISADDGIDLELSLLIYVPSLYSFTQFTIWWMLQRKKNSAAAVLTHTPTFPLFYACCCEEGDGGSIESKSSLLLS